MEKYTGKSILKGIAIGKILFYSREEQVVQRRSITDPEAEPGKPPSNSSRHCMRRR